MIIRSREEQLEALNEAVVAIGRIQYSSAYSSHHDPDFKDIIDFDELCEVHSKLGTWLHEWEKKLNEIKK
jgi:hypothetical protein